MLWFGAKQRTCYCGYPSFCSGWVIKGKYDEGDAFSHYAKTCKTSVSWEIKILCICILSNDRLERRFWLVQEFLEKDVENVPWYYSQTDYTELAGLWILYNVIFLHQLQRTRQKYDLTLM